MITLGFGGQGELSADEEAALQEFLALKMQALLEEHGWYSSYGRDPVVIWIEFEEDDESNLNEEDDK